MGEVKLPDTYLSSRGNAAAKVSHVWTMMEGKRTFLQANGARSPLLLPLTPDANRCSHIESPAL